MTAEHIAIEINNGLVADYFRVAGVEDLSRGARLRLRWFDFYRSHGRNAALTCRHFPMSRKTFHKWKRLYDPKQLGIWCK